MRYALILKLLIKDLRKDAKISFFIVSALTAVIAPLLLLFSLKYGIVSKLQNDLVSDPQNLEIKMDGLSHDLDTAWFEKMSQHQDVQFVIPLTRSLNMEGNVRAGSKNIRDLALIPTRQGDPLIPHHMRMAKGNDVILSAPAAYKLGIQRGDSVILFVRRTIDKEEQSIQVRLTVADVLEERYFNREAAFVDLALLIEIENYKDGFAISRFAQADGKLLEQERSIFAKARLYARDLNSVTHLVKFLRDENFSVRAKDNEIAHVKAINTVLTTIFVIIALTAFVGAVLSLTGSFLANIERKRKDISLLFLFGFKTVELKLYLILQASVLASLAFIGSVGLYFVSGTVINQVMGGNLSDSVGISMLLPKHFVMAFIGVNFIAMVVAMIGSRTISKIQAAEVLREA